MFWNFRESFLHILISPCTGLPSKYFFVPFRRRFETPTYKPTVAAMRWWIVTVFVTWERSQRKIRKFLLPILTNRWSALASIGLYRKPQKQRGSMGTECCFCCIFLNAKPMMNWHLPQLQRNYFWAKSCRAFVQLWHWILVTTAIGGYECSIVMHCNGEELGHLNLVFLKSYNFWSILIWEPLLFRQIKNLSLVSRHFYVLEFEPTWIFSKFYL